ncbi:hypothetical protein ACFPVX_19590 [Cohnella faecalis]|uniref:Uncharacterized protein n=1 Tax=Cohnella faecalis TaxID=2315694 RepID=A0A398CP48_9BACL|nr:hypothetical protein [Cohnella faecalis]RIE04343.1 hypothetical protein D3H35_07010 [Cohnella faecalis]RIE05479.1 hypothetical protein D3H35_00180 [Cohnella faecalis]
MNRSYEVEYCNLELRFDRRQIQNLLRELIQQGYSLYWNESDHLFTVSVRTGRKLLKLRFQRILNRYKLVGDYLVKDEKLALWIEKLIGDSRGHAIVKRFRDRQILIENIMFGEIIRLVEVSGMEHRIIFQKRPHITVEDMVQAFKSKRAELRAGVLRLEIDYELAVLHEAIQEGRAADAEASKEKLKVMRVEMLLLEL